MPDTMMEFSQARDLLKKFKKNSYVFGLGVIGQTGSMVAQGGRRAVLIRSGFPGSDRFVAQIRESLEEQNVALAAEIKGVAPNSPREDLARLTEELNRHRPEVLVTFGGGSNIDAVKAADVLHVLGGDIEDYFGTGLVSKALQNTTAKLHPHVAIQTASGSAAHLTKYSNITNFQTGQKKLIIDDAIVPTAPVFDYRATFDASRDLTADGGLDGISHNLEVLYGGVGKAAYPLIKQVTAAGIALIVNYLPQAMEHPHHPEAREALGLGTDLGGYAIMIGGTNGAHLTSFSLVDILSHGRACGLMNPYYTVLFTPAITDPLRTVGQIFQAAGLLNKDLEKLSGRDLGAAVAQAMLDFINSLGLPTCLRQIPGFRDEHIARALTAAKNPQLQSKLQNMPVPLTAEMVDDYLGPVLEAARAGDLSRIKTCPLPQ